MPSARTSVGVGGCEDLVDRWLAAHHAAKAAEEEQKKIGDELLATARELVKEQEAAGNHIWTLKFLGAKGDVVEFIMQSRGVKMKEEDLRAWTHGLGDLAKKFLVEDHTVTLKGKDLRQWFEETYPEMLKDGNVQIEQVTKLAPDFLVHRAEEMVGADVNQREALDEMQVRALVRPSLVAR